MAKTFKIFKVVLIIKILIYDVFNTYCYITLSLPLFLDCTNAIHIPTNLMENIHMHSLADHIPGKRDFSVLPVFPK